MEKVTVPLGKNSYTIYIENGCLACLSRFIGAADKIFVLTDTNVDLLHGAELDEALKRLNYHKYAIPAGEESKTFQTVETIIDKMLEAQLTRRSLMIAFGGGVVGDLAGFSASIYMRGISYIQIPTTLLAQVDSSVGGKTGVNVRCGKNMAGTFYQPKTVLIDTSVLTTLPKREFTAGMGEVIKYGIIYDYKLCETIEADFERYYALEYNALNKLLQTCCQIKAMIVGRDEKESGLRKILNFGHTVGHAVETLTQYKVYLHGEAVLLGMYYESKLAAMLGLIDADYEQKIIKLIARTKISTCLENISVSCLVRQMETDKKNHDGAISFILPVGMGKVEERLLSSQQVLAMLNTCNDIGPVNGR